MLSAVQPRFANLTPPSAKFSAARAQVAPSAVHFGAKSRKFLAAFLIISLSSLAGSRIGNGIKHFINGGSEELNNAAIKQCTKPNGQLDCDCYNRTVKK